MEGGKEADAGMSGKENEDRLIQGRILDSQGDREGSAV